MSQTSDEILASRRDGIALDMTHKATHYSNLPESGRKAVDYIISLQDRVTQLERKEAAGVFDKVMTSLENSGTTVTLPLSAIEDESYVITGLDQQQYRIVRNDRTVINTEAIKPGFELFTDQRYVLVPASYEEADTSQGMTGCGSGPERIAYENSANPNWVWHAAGNAAAVAAELERRQKKAAFDG